jgi:hypothetical protein
LGTPFFGVPNGPFGVSGSASFATAQQVAETAGSLERLVAFTGRAVHAGA